ncbi:MAG TPA: hypothetical protein DDW52_13885 [Planctomycetaceae bacterium]|nr:hypothetical protein [Planctomycetaceae bacterium]
MEFLIRLLSSRRLLWIPPVMVGIAVFGFFVSRKRELPRKVLEEVARPIEVIEVQMQDLAPSVTGYGSAGPSRRWSAMAEVSGRIIAINPKLETGNRISEGEFLFKIDPTDYKLRLSQRQSDLAVAKASLNELLASEKADKRSLQIERDLLEVSRRDLERNQDLKRQNFVSDSELESTRMSVLMQQQAVQRLENSLSLYASKIDSRSAQIELANSRVAEAQRDLDRTEVICPFTGTLSDVSVEVGQVVAPNQTLFEMHDTSIIEIETHFSLSQLQRVLPEGGDRYTASSMLEHWLPQLQAEVVASSGDVVHRYSGRPLRITESLDAQTRTLGVVIAVENRQFDTSDETNFQAVPELRSGTFCEVRLQTQQSIPVLAVPRSAVEDGHLYRIDGDNRLHREAVELARVIDELAIIAAGLEPGSIIARRPPLPAIEGMLVEPIR